MERCFRTLKNITRKGIQSSWKEGQPDPLQQETLHYDKDRYIVKEGIEHYNDKPHKALFGMSPNRMEEALFIHASHH